MGPPVVTQALVAVGGRARRLRAEVTVGPSKAFMISARRPLLYWCLTSLQWSGITDVVLAGNAPEHLERSMEVADHVVGFNSVTTFRDAGLGVHGIPFQARQILEPHFLFEAGHGVSAPGHYRAMVRAKSPDTIVFSAFTPDPGNPRYRTAVRLDGRCVQGTSHALAHPMVIDTAYADALPDFGFDIARITDDYLGRGGVRAVVSDLPPEFDLPAELVPSLTRYRRGVGAGGFPWNTPPPVRGARSGGGPDGLTDQDAWPSRSYPSSRWSSRSS